MPDRERLAIPQDCPRFGGVVVPILDMGRSGMKHKGRRKVKPGAASLARLQKKKLGRAVLSGGE